MRRFIRQRVLLAALAMFGAFGALAPIGLHTGRAFAASASIADYIGLPGDQVVVVPDGTYAGAIVSAPRPATSGPYKGWLVLVAQSPRGVVIDMSQSPLILTTATNRVLFVGFRFVNGILSVNGDDVAFWYTDHTFPIEEWNRQYQSAGANLTGLTTMPNGVPKAVWVGDMPEGGTVQRTQILGADIHEVGDDGLYIDHSQGALVQGTKIWNVEEKAYDPGFNPWVASMPDLIHNDSVQIPGNVSNLTVADSYLGQTVAVGGDNASSSNLQWNNLWVAGAAGIGLNFFVNPGYRLSGSMRNIQAWSNGFSRSPYDPDWDQVRVDSVDGRQVTWPTSLDDGRLTISSAGSILNQQAPSGVSMSGGRMVDISQALNNEQNPANTWRAAHPYSSWPSLFGISAAPATATSTDAPSAPGNASPPTPTTANATGPASTTAASIQTASPSSAATTTTAIAPSGTNQQPPFSTAGTRPQGRHLAPYARSSSLAPTMAPQVASSTVLIAAALDVLPGIGTEVLPVISEDEVLPVIKVSTDKRGGGVSGLAGLVAILTLATARSLAASNGYAARAFNRLRRRMGRGRLQA